LRKGFEALNAAKSPITSSLDYLTFTGFDGYFNHIENPSRCITAFSSIGAVRIASDVIHSFAIME